MNRILLQNMGYLFNRLFTTARYAVLGCLLSLPLSAQENTSIYADGAGEIEEPPVHLSPYTVGANTEQQMIPDDITNSWTQDATLFKEEEADKVEIRKELQTEATTRKLKNVVPPIRFKSGESDIPKRFITLLRQVLNKMKNRANVRLHFIGHTDSDKLYGAAKEKYGDNIGLSRDRAAVAAEFFQRVLDLPPESVSYDGVGEAKPIASNKTAKGKALNRRVEVEVWYDEIDEKVVEKEVIIEADKLKRVKVCRVETVCKLSYKTGNAKRARLKNLVKPIRIEQGSTEISASYMRQLKEVMHNLRDKQNVMLKFIGHTDNTPLDERDLRIYGTNTALSKARARRVAIAIQEALGLPNRAIGSDGKGGDFPIASNDSSQGRALNRRVEVEFWHDDPLEVLTDEPQICPDAASADTVTRSYEPPTGSIAPILFENGKPVIPAGYAQRLKRILDDIQEKSNVRLNFVGYTSNERMDRRTAMVYGDDIGLSTARARRAMEAIKQEINLGEKEAVFEGRGFVHSRDVVNTGFIEFDSSRVEVEILYDELAMLVDDDGLEITRITRETEAQNPYSLNLMRITVDGKPLHDPNKSVADLQRCTDVALDKASVNFNFDNLEMKPRLNITAWPNTIRYKNNPDTALAENHVRFRSYTNYASFIKKAEVRIFDKKQSIRDEPLAVLEVNKDGYAEWQPRFADYQAPGRELKYLLRVYNKDEIFDETRPLPLWVVDELDDNRQPQAADKELLVGYGENRLAIQNIPLQGGAVKVNGDKIPEEHSVWIAGRQVPVNDMGEFVSEEIFPSGMHSVEVAVLDKEGNGELFLRELEFDKSDWFYVGIADITAAKDSTNGPAQMVTGDTTHYDNDLDVYGRIAFYANGKFGDGWELTTSADTLEEPIDDIFSNTLNKSPDSLIRRIDPDYHYPSFGDDSSVEEDAPTSGKFYLKLKKQNDYLLWGNFDIAYTDNELAHVDRGLYGGNAHYESNAVTSFGERRFIFDGFAAEPGTVAGRDEFRGTSGSLYYLKHQDILTGSDRLRVEVRDKDSGLVVGVVNLTTAIDYDIDYIQGRILLSEPLSAIAEDNQLIQSGGGSGNPVYLVARYEYTPGFDDTKQLATGGRVHYWFGDSVKLGITNSQQGEDADETKLNGADITLRKNAGTWVKLEVANSEGQGSGSLNSNDGGFTFEQESAGLGLNDKAGAYKLEASVSLGDIFEESTGTVTFYNQHRDAGFSAPGQLTSSDTEQTGGSLAMPLSDSVSLRVKADKKQQAESLDTTAVEASAAIRLSENWELSAGMRGDDRTDNSTTVAATQTQGERYDVTVKASYDSKADWTVYNYIQTTTNTTGNREENNRIGVGGSYRTSDSFKVNGEISGGDTGSSAQLGTEYLVSDRTNLYLNYTLENERTDNGVRSQQGNMASGFRTRYSDSASVYLEERYTHGDVPTGLTHSVGVDLAPNDRWNFGINLDKGSLTNNKTGAITDRTAAALKIGYSFESATYGGAVEYRVDENEAADTSVSERTTWLMKNSLKYQVNPDWRLIAKLNHSESESSLGEFYDGDFTEAVIGYAYRPVDNDRWNTLFKYTYFYNVPATDQVTLDNTAAEYIQRSNIISVDTLYDLTQNWTIGAKYGYRNGEISQDRLNPEFFKSRASLYVLRADWHFAHRWDALIEARMLDLPDAQDSRSGALLGLYRHVGKNFKFGLGYNYTDFSDDLTDLDYDSEGFFINVIGKM